MVAVDRYDALRRAWIADHRGWSTIQDRRHNRLDVTIRRRQRIVTGAVPDPHDDTVLPPIWLRIAQSPAARTEWIAVNTLAVLVPLGWPLGYLAHRLTTRTIPTTLRAYPITAMLTAGAALGALTILGYSPGDSVVAILLDAWIPMQIAAIPAVAGIYGILDGWLAIPGSTAWWPLTPQHHHITNSDADEILGSYDLTGPGLIDARPLVDEQERHP